MRKKRWDKVFSKIGKQTTTHGDPCSTVLLNSLLIDLFRTLSYVIPGELALYPGPTGPGQVFHLFRIADNPVYAPGYGLGLDISQQPILEVVDYAHRISGHHRLAPVMRLIEG